jgi:predicted nuclease of predicted toxin-antitoxin system
LKKRLLDQGLPRSAGVILSQRGWDAVHVGDVGMAAATDVEILGYAKQETRVVVTLDADFHAMLAVSSASAPSVVRIRIERLKGLALADLLEKIWSMAQDDLSRGAMVTVTERSLRIKHLPVG